MVQPFFLSKVIGFASLSQVPSATELTVNLIGATSLNEAKYFTKH